MGRADRAHADWAASSTVEDRVALIRRVGEIYSERREELAEIIVREMGKPIAKRSVRSVLGGDIQPTTPTMARR